MKILVGIASYGTNNDNYLTRLLEEYKALPYDVHIVVVSNIQKNLGDDVEVVVGLPSRNPWSLPFAHKAIFAEHVDDYDLFIYTEDDTLITHKNIEAFLWATSVLQPDELAGFMRSEQGTDGTLYYSTIHHHYHWDVNSVCQREHQTFAHFTNEHSACYLLTQGQLRRAITSGGFLVPPHEGKYDMLVSAATDPYTQCGMRKLVCLTRLADFTCQHLTNKYVGRTGVDARVVQAQVDSLIEMGNSSEPPPQPIRVETFLPGTRWTKSYYEACRDDLVALVTPGTRVLSLGCGSGDTEVALLARNVHVTAVPLDAVIGGIARSRGIRVIPTDLQGAVSYLDGEVFDLVLIFNLIHLIEDPATLLQKYLALLAPGGQLVATLPNLRHPSVQLRRLTRDPSVRGLTEYQRSGVHQTSMALLKHWLLGAGFAVQHSTSTLTGRWVRYDRLSLGLLRGTLASEFSVTARRPAGKTVPVHPLNRSISTESAGSLGQSTVG